MKIRKTAVLAALLATVLAVGGCNGTAQQRLTTPPVQPINPEKMNDVRMLITDRYDDREVSKRQQEVLDIIAQDIQRQKNVMMHIALISCRPGTKLSEMAASDNLPEIVVRTPAALEWDDPDYSLLDSDIPPMRLNEAIDAYGPNLKNVPEACWEISRLGDSIVSIPATQQAPKDFLALNQEALDGFGWAAPRTFQELEELLPVAQASGVQPLMEPLPPAWFGIPHDLDGNCPYLFQDDSGALLSYYESPAYLKYLETMRDWKQKGYILYIDADSAPDYGSDKDWLTRPYTGAPGETALPPMAPKAGDEFIGSGYKTKFQLEAYHRPEALVTLFDWALASEENYLLLQCGQADVDYTLDSAGNAKTTRLSLQLSSLGLYFQTAGLDAKRAAWMGEAGQSPDDAAVVYCGEHASRTDKLIGLPAACWRYDTARETGLRKACDNQRSYEKAMVKATASCIAGATTLEDYRNTAKQNAGLLSGYVDLVRKYRAGGYDPTQDMLKPAVG